MRLLRFLLRLFPQPGRYWCAVCQYPIANEDIDYIPNHTCKMGMCRRCGCWRPLAMSPY